jgi:5-methylcytosine-specific restriction endonuclease McrA
MDRDSLERLLGQGLSLAEIGRRIDRDESTVGYWVAKHGLRVNGRDLYAARGGLSREELQRLVERGDSIAEMAAELERSKASVRHWLKKYDLRTANPPGQRRSAAARSAWDAGLTRAEMECPSHGAAEYVLDARGYYRCTRCRSAAVSRRRRRIKATLVQEAGGACSLCRYRRCLAALEFHHLVPAEKEFSVSQKGVTRSIERAREEARKCVLLCGNCHAEVEAGLIPLDLSGRPE